MDRNHKVNLKLIILLLLMGVVNILLAYFIQRSSTYELFAAFAFLFVLYYIICKQHVCEKQFYILITGAIALRLIWLFAFPNLSDDYARFIWDGRLSVAGYNPFKYLPKDIMDGGLPGFSADNALYNALNSQTYYTCYPPLLQLLFSIGTFIFPHSIYGNIVVLKSFSLFAEIGSVFILIALCKRWNINKTNVLLYALNPVVIAELTGNLHFEGIMIFFLLATVYCWERNRYWLSMILLMAAIIAKLIPLMLLPLVFFYFKGRRGALYCLGVFVLTVISWLPYVNSTVAEKFWSSIDSYFQESEYNASIYYVTRDVTYYFTGENKIQIIGPVLTVLSGILIVSYAIWKRSNINMLQLLKYFTWTLLIYYAFTTTVFPWYVTPAIAFAVFTGYKFPLVWSAVVVLSYYADRTTAFIESYSLIWIEYTILALSIIWDMLSEDKKSRLVIKY